jgi:hypothetical protein
VLRYDDSIAIRDARTLNKTGVQATCLSASDSTSSSDSLIIEKLLVVEVTRSKERVKSFENSHVSKNGERVLLMVLYALIA